MTSCERNAKNATCIGVVVALLCFGKRWSVKLQRGSSDEIGVKIGGQLEN